MMRKNWTKIAITLGEPAGIGPDVIIMLAQQSYQACLIAIGDPDVLKARAEQLGLPLQLVDYRADAPLVPLAPGMLYSCPVPLPSPAMPGQLNPDHAEATLACLDVAIQGCQSGEFAAMVTGPMHKALINQAGIAFSGHTEYLAEKTNTEQVVMLLAAGKLRVALATTHLPLQAVPSAITANLLQRILGILQHDLQAWFKLKNPHIAVCGLNPHAGEGGYLGREEIDIIAPAIATCVAQGMHISGPLPADTIFSQDLQADVVLAMYHDQGLPVLKYASFGNAVNITLGLPFIRTSVDHGTALDLAGTGKADAGSMIEAVKLAIELSHSRK